MQAHEMSDLRYPDFAQLLATGIKRLRALGLEPFTVLETVVIGFITVDEPQRTTGVADRIVYEIDHLLLPKYVALVTWLNPFGMVSHEPGIVLRIANYLLGYTTQEEEARLPVALRKELGV